MPRSRKILEATLDNAIMQANLVSGLICEKAPNYCPELDYSFLSTEYAMQRQEDLYQAYNNSTNEQLANLVKRSTIDLEKRGDRFYDKYQRYQKRSVKTNKDIIALFKLGYELLLDCSLLHALSKTVKKGEEKDFRDSLKSVRSIKGKIILNSIRGTHKAITTLKRHSGYHPLGSAAVRACLSAQFDFAFADMFKDFVAINQIESFELTDAEKAFLNSGSCVKRSRKQTKPSGHSKTKFETLIEQTPSEIPKPEKHGCFSFFFCCTKRAEQAPTVKSALIMN